MKKFFTVGMAVILGASLSFFGCESATDGTAGAAGESGAAAPNTLEGTKTVAQVQAVIDLAISDGAAVRLFDLTLSDAGIVDFKTATVQILGELQTAVAGGTIINAVNATVVFIADGEIAGSTGDIILGSKAAFPDEKVTTATVAEPAAGGELPTVGGVTAIEDLTLTGDLSIAAGLKVYVYGTLTINGTADAPASYGNGIVAIGTVKVEKDNSDALSAATKVDASGAAITTASTVTALTLPPAAAAKSLTAEGALVISGAGTSLTLGSLTGSVTLPAAITSVTIAGGTGSVSVTPTSPLTKASFGNTGATTFGGDVEFSTAAASFGGNAVFKGNVTLTAIGATFSDDAFFADGKAITLTTNASVITLKPGAELAQGEAAKIPGVYSAIIANFSEDDVTLTPDAGTVLTFGASGTKSITQSGTSGHGITIGGNATLVPSATYTVASESSNVGTLTVGGTLVIGAGLLASLPEGTVGDGIDNTDATSSKLVLTGATDTNGALLAGDGAVIAGKTTIIGGENGWQAVAASGTPTVTIEKDSIAGSAAVALTAQHADSAITVAAGGTLTVDGVAVTLDTSKGTVTLTGATTGGAKLLLKGHATNPASLVADSSKVSADVTGNSPITLQPSGGSDDTDATVTGTSIILKSDTADATSTAQDLGTVGGGDAADTNDATITGPSDGSYNSAIANGWKVKTTAG